MIDDLDRALFALPLEEPPEGLHASILAVTVERPTFPFGLWDVMAIGVAAAVAVWCMLWVMFAPQAVRVLQHDFALALQAGATLAVGGPGIALWFGAGIVATMYVLCFSGPLRTFAESPSDPVGAKYAR